MLRIRLLAIVVVTAALALAGVARAQTLPTFPVSDVLRTNYFDNAGGSTDAFVRITNPGVARVNLAPGAGDGSLCAMIYIFRPDQEFAACCGCKVTPNALLKLSVNRLVSNPLNGSAPTAGVIKIVSALPNNPTIPVTGSSNACDAGGLTATTAANVIPTPDLREWGTHIDDTGAITEEEFAGAPLSLDEDSALLLNCAIAEGTALPPGTGSGHGTCDCTNQLTGAIDP